MPNHLACVYVEIGAVPLVTGLAVERSNNMKRKARIMEGSNTRVERHEAGLLLISAEIILCCAGLYHLSKGWESPKSPINLSDI
jgi:hypothetical protein